MNLERDLLIATNGFQFYKRVICRILGPACLYGQVIKTRRNDRIINVERRTVIGDAWRFEETLRDSEDSSKLNTSFVEGRTSTFCMCAPPNLKHCRCC